MKKIVLIAENPSTDIINYAQSLSSHHRVTLLTCTSAQYDKPHSVEILTPFENFSTLEIMGLAPFFVGLQCDVFHILAPEKTKKPFRLELLSAILRAIPGRQFVNSHSLPLSLALPEIAEVKSSAQPEYWIAPHSLSSLSKSQQGRLLRPLKYSSLDILFWDGWGEKSFSQRNLWTIKNLKFAHRVRLIPQANLQEKTYTLHRAAGFLAYELEDITIYAPLIYHMITTLRLPVFLSHKQSQLLPFNLIHGDTAWIVDQLEVDFDLRPIIEQNKSLSFENLSELTKLRDILVNQASRLYNNF